MPNVPMTNVNAYYSNTSPGNTILSNVIDSAIQDIVQAINDNWAIYESFVTNVTLPIPDQSIVERHIRNLAVTNPKLAPLAVTNDKIADGTITAAKLADLLITTSKLADLSVTNGKLVASSVTGDKIANSTITTDKLQDLLITTAKLAEQSVIESKLGTSSVSSRALAPQSVTASKLDPSLINPISDAGIQYQFGLVNEQLAETETDLDSRGLNVKDLRFGAIGDGLSHPLSDFYATLSAAQVKYPHATSLSDEVDWCALQAAVDYAYSNDMYLVFIPNGFYLINKPLVLKTKKLTTDYFWAGKGIKVVGQDIDRVKIIKTGSGVLTGMAAEINNIDSTIILFNQFRDGVENNGGQSTGIQISDITISNQSTSITSMAVTGKASNRMLFENLNIIGHQGIIFDTSYSNIFQNIVFTCQENALKIIVGTSNTFQFLYAPGCKNPYTVLSAYSNMFSVCADDSTGIIYNVNGNGLVMSGCGTESPRAQYIVKCEYSGRANNTATITGLYCMRQSGDVANGLNIADCAVFFGIGYIKVESLNIVDTQEITGNSYLLDVGSAAALCSLDIGLITYYKNYSGGVTNPHLLYSKTLGNGLAAGKIHSSGIAVNVRRNKIMPYLGSFNAAQSILTGFIDKAIYLDNEDKTHSADGTDLSLQVKYNIGDWLLINNPKARNIAGYVVTDNTAGSALYVSNCTFAEIPINLVYTTATRPTSNLFPGLRVYDSTLNKPIWRNAANSAWVDATGTTV